ncbi:unnamed protein product [Parnassius apollo]|uniref:(apollo) hypothetical protein n=1 Tax=Parnassius apollo TaxID=110799 RepID=A0A8S3XDA2_PARAO|nr:unnamed protein product [Parnassius apollo]
MTQHWLLMLCMWNPGNNPVPQVFIDVILDEEEAEEAVIDEEVGEQDDWDISSMSICYVRSDGSWGHLSELLVEPAEVSGSPAPAPAAAPVAAPEAVPGPAPRRVEADKNTEAVRDTSKLVLVD